jgi:hypothetical protein
MKRVYTFSILFFCLFLCTCSKDFLKSYDKRIVGTWRITDINRIGFGGNTSNLPFERGTFTFHSNGTLEYVNSSNGVFKGSWDIINRKIGEENVNALQITAINFTTQEVLSQYYDDMLFLSTNHFKTTINSTYLDYMTHFYR